MVEFRNFILLSSLSAFALLSSSDGWAQEKGPAVKISKAAVGQYCVIQLKQQKPKTETEFAGKIVAVDRKSIELAKPRLTVRVETGAPGLLGKIPLINRLFKNVGVGVEEITGNRQIPLDDIEKIQLKQARPGGSADR